MLRTYLRLERAPMLRTYLRLGRAPVLRTYLRLEQVRMLRTCHRQRLALVLRTYLRLEQVRMLRTYLRQRLALVLRTYLRQRLALVFRTYLRQRRARVLRTCHRLGRARTRRTALLPRQQARRTQASMLVHRTCLPPARVTPRRTIRLLLGFDWAPGMHHQTRIRPSQERGRRRRTSRHPFGLACRSHRRLECRSHRLRSEIARVGRERGQLGTRRRARGGNIVRHTQ
jgi:hypothetical protein